MKKYSSLYLSRTVAVVVGLEGDVDVLDDGEEHKAVDDEGERPQQVVGVADAVLESARVHEQRRRPNVAVQYPHALERKPQRLRPAILYVSIDKWHDRFLRFNVTTNKSLGIRYFFLQRTRTS